jgi:hypothetical protein
MVWRAPARLKLLNTPSAAAQHSIPLHPSAAAHAHGSAAEQLSAEQVLERMLAELKRAARDGDTALQLTAVSLLFDLLEHLTSSTNNSNDDSNVSSRHNNSAFAPYVFKALVFTLIEHHDHEVLYGFVATNFARILMASNGQVDANRGGSGPDGKSIDGLWARQLPVGALVEPFAKQLELHGYRGAEDVNLCLALASHRRLGGADAARLVALAGAIGVRDRIYSTAALEVVRACLCRGMALFSLSPALQQPDSPAAPPPMSLSDHRGHSEVVLRVLGLVEWAIDLHVGLTSKTVGAATALAAPKDDEDPDEPGHTLKQQHRQQQRQQQQDDAARMRQRASCRLLQVLIFVYASPTALPAPWRAPQRTEDGGATPRKRKQQRVLRGGVKRINRTIQRRLVHGVDRTRTLCEEAVATDALADTHRTAISIGSAAVGGMAYAALHELEALLDDGMWLGEGAEEEEEHEADATEQQKPSRAERKGKPSLEEKAERNAELLNVAQGKADEDEGKADEETDLLFSLRRRYPRRPSDTSNNELVLASNGMVGAGDLELVSVKSEVSTRPGTGLKVLESDEKGGKTVDDQDKRGGEDPEVEELASLQMRAAQLAQLAQQQMEEMIVLRQEENEERQQQYRQQQQEQKTSPMQQRQLTQPKQLQSPRQVPKQPTKRPQPLGIYDSLDIQPSFSEESLNSSVDEDDAVGSATKAAAVATATAAAAFEAQQVEQIQLAQEKLNEQIAQLAAVQMAYAQDKDGRIEQGQVYDSPTMKAMAAAEAAEAEVQKIVQANAATRTQEGAAGPSKQPRTPPHESVLVSRLDFATPSSVGGFSPQKPSEGDDGDTTSTITDSSHHQQQAGRRRPSRVVPGSERDPMLLHWREAPIGSSDEDASPAGTQLSHHHDLERRQIILYRRAVRSAKRMWSPYRRPLAKLFKTYAKSGAGVGAGVADRGFDTWRKQSMSLQLREWLLFCREFGLFTAQRPSSSSTDDADPVDLLPWCWCKKGDARTMFRQAYARTLIQSSPTQSKQGAKGNGGESVPLGLVFADFLLCLRAVALGHALRLNAISQRRSSVSFGKLLPEEEALEEERVCAAALAQQMRAASQLAQEGARRRGMPEAAARQGDPRAWDVDVLGWAQKQQEQQEQQEQLRQQFASPGTETASQKARLASARLLPESLVAALYVLDVILDKAVGTKLLLDFSPRAGNIYGSIRESEDEEKRQLSAHAADKVAGSHEAIDMRVQQAPSAHQFAPSTHKQARSSRKQASHRRRADVSVKGLEPATDTLESVAKQKQSQKGRTYAEAKRDADAEQYKKQQEAERKRKKRVQQTKRRLEKMRQEREKKEVVVQEQKQEQEQEQEMVLQEKLLEEKEKRLQQRRAEIENQEKDEIERFKREVQEFKRVHQPKTSPLQSPRNPKQPMPQLELDVSPLQSPLQSDANAGREQGQLLLGLMTGGAEGAEGAEEAEESVAAATDETVHDSDAGCEQGQRVLGLMVGGNESREAKEGKDAQSTPQHEQLQQLQHSPLQSPRRVKSSRHEEVQAPIASATGNRPWEIREGEWVGDWLTSFDPSDGAAYYHNQATGVTQWDKPREVALEEARRRRAAAQVRQAKEAAKAALQQADEVTQRLSPRRAASSPKGITPRDDRANAKKRAARVTHAASSRQNTQAHASPRSPQPPSSPLRSPHRSPHRLARAKSAAEDHDLSVPKVAAEKFDVRKRKGEEEKKRQERQANERRKRRQEAVHARLEVARQQREEKEIVEQAKKETEAEQERTRKLKQRKLEARRRKEAKTRVDEFQKRKHEAAQAEAAKKALLDDAQQGTTDAVAKADKAERKREWLSRQAELKEQKRKKDQKKEREETAAIQARLKVRGFVTGAKENGLQEQVGDEMAHTGLSHLRVKQEEVLLRNFSYPPPPLTSFLSRLTISGSRTRMKRRRWTRGSAGWPNKELLVRREVIRW